MVIDGYTWHSGTNIQIYGIAIYTFDNTSCIKIATIRSSTNVSVWGKYVNSKAILIEKTVYPGKTEEYSSGWNTILSTSDVNTSLKLSLTSGKNITAGCRISKSGITKTLYFDFSYIDVGSISGDINNIGSIPSDYRPVFDLTTTIVDTGGSTYLFRLGKDGTVSLQKMFSSANTSAYLTGVITYV